MNGKLILLVGPSGSGKSTIFKELKKQHRDYVFPVSVTTRPMRENEKEGEVYHFTTPEEFEKKLAKGELLEHAKVHQTHYYGLLKQPILDNLKHGKTIVREVNIQGLESVKKIIPKKNLVTIFITVASIEELKERIIGRAKITQEELEHRIESMKKEFGRAKECDYLIENKNGEINKTVQKVESIIKSETEA